jgi:hypothetical protein
MSSNLKYCPRCEQRKPFEDFSRHKSRPDGRCAYCRVCSSEYSRQFKAANPEATREASRRWRAENRDVQRELNHRWAAKNRGAAREACRQWRIDNPEKVAAHNAVSTLIKAGKFPRPDEYPCARPGCPEPASQYHHWSYEPEHRLSVIPLCTACHYQLHADQWELGNLEELSV